MNRRARPRTRTGSTGPSISTSSPMAKRPPPGSTCSASHTLAWARVSSNRTGSSIRNAPLREAPSNPVTPRPSRGRGRSSTRTGAASTTARTPASGRRASGPRRRREGRRPRHRRRERVDHDGPGLVGGRHLAGDRWATAPGPRVAHVEVGQHLGHRSATGAISGRVVRVHDRQLAVGVRLGPQAPDEGGERRRLATTMQSAGPFRPIDPQVEARGGLPGPLGGQAGHRRHRPAPAGQERGGQLGPQPDDRQRVVLATAPATTSADSSPRLWPTTPTTPSPPAAAAAPGAGQLVADDRLLRVGRAPAR